MRKQTTLICAVLVTAAGFTPAVAAKSKPKPVCNLVVDASGDGKAAAFFFVKTDGLDILGLDVATTAKTLGAVLRMKSTELDTPTSTIGYAVSLHVDGSAAYEFNLTRSKTLATPETQSASFTAADGSAGVVPTVKITGTTITFTVPRSAVAHLARRGAVLGTLQASTRTTGSNADYAGNTATYRDLTPSCLTLP